MRKWIRFTGMVLLAAAFLWCGSVLRDRKALNENLIRFHVVANSDSEADQSMKLRVRDALTEKLAPAMEKFSTVREAENFLSDNLADLEDFANQFLEENGCRHGAKITLQKEAYRLRKYDTFDLPAGVYRSLRVTIGEGAGKNWWCVVFPSLCIPAASEGMEDIAAGAGFEQSLTGAIARNENCRVRFYFLELLGRLENLWFSRREAPVF